MQNLDRFGTVLLLTCLCTPFIAAQQIPAGTVLPVVLERTLDARRDRAGKTITAEVMQEVPLANGATVPKGTRIAGQIIAAIPASAGSPSQLSMRFDRISFGGRRFPVVTDLRALASAREVFEAKLPTNAIDDYGTSESDWNTIQIGGAGVYRGDGKVVEGDRVVGRTTHYGAVTAELVAVPAKGCDSDGGGEQALWLFSPWACGVYGYSDLRVVHSGDTAPVGEIRFESNHDIRIQGGSGLLLRAETSTLLSGR
jgi:hypothetical protein